MRDIYQDFEQENPDVKLNQLSMPSGSEMVRKTEDLLVAGEIPDLVFWEVQVRILFISLWWRMILLLI